MTRGFVTIATGKREYYEMARNLLVSYRFHTRNPLPFAIICDRRNALTRDFDEVVTIDSASCSYSDKILILDLSPFDESIFVDSDCLAYADLDGLWDLFKDSPPLGLLGIVLPLDSEKSWLKVENTGIFKDNLENFIICQGGMYYFRRDIPDGFKETVDYIAGHYTGFKFSHSRITPCDETVFTLACAVHRYYPSHDWSRVFCYYPMVSDFKGLDIRTGTLEYSFLWETGTGNPDNGKFLLHWGTEHTRGWLYVRELERLFSSVKGRPVNPFRLACRLAVSYSRAIVSAIRRIIKRTMPLGMKTFLYKLIH